MKRVSPESVFTRDIRDFLSKECPALAQAIPAYGQTPWHVIVNWLLDSRVSIIGVIGNPASGKTTFAVELGIFQAWVHDEVKTRKLEQLHVREGTNYIFYDHILRALYPHFGEDTDLWDTDMWGFLNVVALTMMSNPGYLERVTSRCEEEYVGYKASPVFSKTTDRTLSTRLLQLLDAMKPEQLHMLEVPAVGHYDRGISLIRLLALWRFNPSYYAAFLNVVADNKVKAHAIEARTQLSQEDILVAEYLVQHGLVDRGHDDELLNRVRQEIRATNSQLFTSNLQTDGDEMLRNSASRFWIEQIYQETIEEVDAWLMQNPTRAIALTEIYVAHSMKGSVVERIYYAKRAAYLHMRLMALGVPPQRVLTIFNPSQASFAQNYSRLVRSNGR